MSSRIHGELLVLGIKVVASTVQQILTDAEIDPTDKRTSNLVPAENLIRAGDRGSAETHARTQS